MRKVRKFQDGVQWLKIEKEERELFKEISSLRYMQEFSGERSEVQKSTFANILNVSKMKFK